MSAKSRALIIGLTGPVIQVVGFVWTLLHLVVSHWHEPLSFRHLAFEPTFLLIVVGFLVSVICIPVAIEVALARPEELAIPVFELSETDSDLDLKAGAAEPE